MVTAYKAESKNEEIWDKLRARSVVATDPGEGTAELGRQKAKLMAALAKAGQGNNPSSVLSSPLERACGRRCNGSSTPRHQTPILVGLALDRLPQPAAYPPGVGQGASEIELMNRVIKGPVQGGRAQAITGIQTSSNASGARGGATWPANAYLSNSFKPTQGGPDGMWLTPSGNS